MFNVKSKIASTWSRSFFLVSFCVHIKTQNLFSCKNSSLCPLIILKLSPQSIPFDVWYALPLQAGLIDDVDSGQLLIALEPEAASLYCRQLSISEFVERSRGSEIRMGSGTKYIVIDAGGKLCLVHTFGNYVTLLKNFYKLFRI